MQSVARSIKFQFGFILMVVAELGGQILAQQPVPQDDVVPGSLIDTIKLTPKQSLTQNDVIHGEMTIDFKTRLVAEAGEKSKASIPKFSSQDIYQFKFTVVDTTEYLGTMYRYDEVERGAILNKKQLGQIKFAIDLAVRHPKKPDARKVVGEWSGIMPLDMKTGVYLLDGSTSPKERLRIQIEANGGQAAFSDRFFGKLVGRPRDVSGLSDHDDRRGETSTEKDDSLKFENLALARGPSPNYPHVIVNGRLDYDVKTGGWLTDRIEFRYSHNGGEFTDLVTGTINRIADEKIKGQGYFDFNVRFNDQNFRPGESAFDEFAKLSNKKTFFTIDEKVPCITGKVSYEDEFATDNDADALPIKRKLTVNLNANKITKVQAVNFFKLWLLATCPMNEK